MYTLPVMLAAASPPGILPMLSTQGLNTHDREPVDDVGACTQTPLASSFLSVL